MSDNKQAKLKPEKKQKECRAKAGFRFSDISGILLSGAVALPLMLALFSAATRAHFSRLLAIDEKSPAAADPTQRLLFALRWLSPVCLLVIVFVQAVAFSRLFSPSRDGKTPNWLTDLLRNILQNTFEQAFLLTLNLLALSQNIRPDQLVVIPMLVGLFLIARVAFAVGYLIEPTKRALGFVLTFAPNVAVAGYNVYCLASDVLK